MRKTKILATLGPACNNVEIMKNMIESGLDAARINCSHGTIESRLEIVNNLKAAREATGKHIALLLDTKGPEIRTKTFVKGKAELKQGQTFTLTTQDIEGDDTRVAVSYENLPSDLKVGSRVLFDDGLIEMKVTAIEGTEVECILINSGVLGNRKGVNLPDVTVNLPSLTQQDEDDIIFGIKEDFDYIAASFVRNAGDVTAIRHILEKNGGSHLRIIAKIESRDGVNNLDEILEVADGIMVARGDMGVELNPEEVPIVQKNMIKACNQAGKLVITATHMLESMVDNPRPTRAEANDVANAVFDGTDVIMLSGETANGQYPVAAVAMMGRIAFAAEENPNYQKEVVYKNVNKNVTNTMSHYGASIAADLDATCIVTITDSGFAARMASSARPVCPILAVTNSEQVCRQLNMSWGCVPVISPTKFGDAEDIFQIAEDMALKAGLAKSGEPLVALAGVPVGVAGTTNTIRVRIAGDVLVRGKGNNRGVVKGIARVFTHDKNCDRANFQPGDIIICTQTDDTMMPYLRKASALVVGSWEKVDVSHANTVMSALELPAITTKKERPIDRITTGSPVTVDTIEGLVINGYRE